MKGDEFKILLNRLKASDEDAWLSIKSHVGIIITSWAKREKFELDWVASTEGIGSAGNVLSEVYSRFRDELLSGNLETDNYTDYKAAIFIYTKEILEDQFARFYTLIMEGDHTAWRKVNERIYLYTAKWFSDRKIKAEAIRDIYQESMLTFFEKVTLRELSFETSREIKSYYFRILELKTMEGNRKKMIHTQRWSETDSGHLFRPMPEERFETDDKFFFIEKIMRDSISRDEAFILKQYYFHEEKLSDIAKALHISDGNCRQKKLQALRKIAAVYNQIEVTKLQKQIFD